MALPRNTRPERAGILDGIKSKLGFANSSKDRYDDEYYDDYGEEYQEGYAEYGPDYDDDAPSGRYDPYAPVTTRTPQRSGRTSRATSSDFPKLVSIDDVRANTQVPDSLRRDPLPSRRAVSSSSASQSYRTVVEAGGPAPSSPAHTAARRERSEGLNSLFEPSASEAALASADGSGSAAHGAPAPAAYSAPAPAAHGAPTAPTSAAATASFDPYEAYAGSGAAAHNPSRSISVLKPASYGEAEHVAKILKAGDVAVIALRNTPDQLSKRILDFSFGVSSALDASVECVADKVFAITRGAALSDAERQALRNQGVL